MSKNSPLAARRIIDDEYAMSLDVDELCRVTEEAEREARVVEQPVEQPTDPPDRPPFVIERTHVYHPPAGVLQPEPQSLAAYEDEEIEAMDPESRKALEQDVNRSWTGPVFPYSWQKNKDVVIDTIDTRKKPPPPAPHMTIVEWRNNDNIHSADNNKQLAKKPIVNPYSNTKENDGKNKRGDDYKSPTRKIKAVRKTSPVFTPSPPPAEDVLSQPSALITRPAFNLCPYCLQNPCEQKEDLDDTKQRLALYFPARIYDNKNDIPGNFQRRRTFKMIYKEIVLAKGRDIYAKCLPACAKAAAHELFPTEPEQVLGYNGLPVNNK